jgi:hypothetical protein
MFILEPSFSVPDSGSKRYRIPDPESKRYRITDPDPQQCLNLSHTKLFYIAVIIAKTTRSMSKSCLVDIKKKPVRIKSNTTISDFNRKKFPTNRGRWCFGNSDLSSFLPHWNLYDHANKFTPFLIYHPTL